MEVVPLDPKRIKLSQIKDYKSNWQHIEHQVSKRLKWKHFKRRKKIRELNYENKTHSDSTNESTDVIEKGGGITFTELEQCFINQT